MATTTSLGPTVPVDDGGADFDFLHGDWTVVARRTTDVLDPHCDDWAEFETTQTARPLLGGFGNTDSWATDQGPTGRRSSA